MSANAPQAAMGLRLIVAYKFVKSAAEIALGITLFALASAGLAREVRDVALGIRDHATAAWSAALAERLVRAATERNLEVVALASVLDGGLSFVEGWALRRGYRWGRWLVVGATACLVPFEIVALIHHLSAGRILILLLNALIVIYLVGGARAKAD